MEPGDWTRVADIYRQGLESGKATFATECPDYSQWDGAHLPLCRFVAVMDGQVVGWTALSPTSSRWAYRGVAEVSVYVDSAAQGRGMGTALLERLCRESEQAGIWSLYAAIFSTNAASIALHRKCGFREIGYRERIAQDRLGVWQNTTLMERRAKD